MSRKLEVVIVGNDASLQRALGRSAAAANTFAGRMNRVGGQMKSIGSSMTKNITTPILALATGAGVMAYHFEESMQRLRTSAGASQAEVDRMSSAVLKLSKTAQGGTQSPEKLAEALYYIESSGIRGGKALKVLSAAAVNAGVTGADLTEVTKALTSAVKVGIKGTENEAKAMGTLNAIVGAGKMTMDDLTGALSTGILPAAKLVGISLPQLGAALDTFTIAGMPAQQSATKLTATFLRMMSPTKAAAASLKNLGLGSADLANALQKGGLTDALGLLVKKYQETSAKSGEVFAKQQLMAAFGRSRGGAVILALVDGWDQYNSSLKQVNKTSTDYIQNAAKAMNTTPYKIKQAWASLQGSLVQLGVVLLPVFAKLAEFVSRVMGAFDRLSPSTKKLVLILAGVAAVAGPLIGTIGSLAIAIGALSGPVGWVILGIAAVSAAFTTLMVKSPKFRKEVTDALRGISDYFRTVLLPTIRSVVETIRVLWDKFGKDLTAVVKVQFGMIAAIIGPTLRTISASIRLFAALLRGDWSAAWKALKDIVKAQLDLVVGVFRKSIAMISATGRAMVNAAVTIATGIAHAFAKFGSTLGPIISSAMRSAYGAIMSWIGAAYSAAVAMGKSIAQGVLDGVSSLASRLASSIHHAISGAVSAAGKLLHGSGDFQFTKHAVGEPLAKGVIEGWMLGIASLKTGMSASLINAINHSKSKMKTAASQLASAIVAEFKKLATQANAALAKIGKNWKSPSGKILAGMQGADEKSSLTGAVSDAQAALADAQSGGLPLSPEAAKLAQMQAEDTLAGYNDAISQAQADLAQALADGDAAAAIAAQTTLDRAKRDLEEYNLAQTVEAQNTAAAKQTAILAAEQQLADAKRALLEYNLGLDAEKEQAQHDKDVAAKQKNFDAALIALEKHLLAEHAKRKTALKALRALYKKYGVPFDAGELSAAAALVAAAVAAVTGKKVGSGKAGGGSVMAGVGYPVGERGPEFFIPSVSGTIIPNGRGGGGAVVINIPLSNVWGDADKAALMIRDRLKRLQNTGQIPSVGLA